MVDVLDVLVVLHEVDHLGHVLDVILVGELDIVLGNHLDAGGSEDVALLLHGLDHGVEVVGTDYNAELVATLNAGKTTFEEDGLTELFESALEKGITFTTEYISTDVYIVSVPTPYDKFTKKVDACYLISAVESVLNVCPKGAISIGEATTNAMGEPITYPDVDKTVCDDCGACAKECPGNAVPDVRDKEKRIEIDYGEKKVWYGDVRMGRCTLSHHGFNNECSPFHKKEFPNMAFDVRNSEMTEEEAYILCYAMAGAKWGRKPDTNAVLEYYDYILKHTGYFAICGARGCIRACMDKLEKAGRIESKFHHKFYKRPSWPLPNQPEKVSEGVNPSREEFLDANYPGIRENEYKKK